jgi:hypothetical protein
VRSEYSLDHLGSVVGRPVIDYNYLASIRLRFEIDEHLLKGVT